MNDETYLDRRRAAGAGRACARAGHARARDGTLGYRARFYEVLVADADWPDDTLLEFHPSAPDDRTVYSAQPIYLRGSMDHWGAGHALRQIDATTYGADIALPSGRHEFKVGTADFKALELGAGSTGAGVTPGEAHKLAWKGRNLALQVEQPATFHFTLKVQDPDRPVLTVTR